MKEPQWAPEAKPRREGGWWILYAKKPVMFCELYYSDVAVLRKKNMVCNPIAL